MELLVIMLLILVVLCVAIIFAFLVLFLIDTINVIKEERNAPKRHYSDTAQKSSYGVYDGKNAPPSPSVLGNRHSDQDTSGIRNEVR